MKVVIDNAIPCVVSKPQAGPFACRMPDGTVVMDAMHISDAFASLFPSGKDSFFNVTWLGNQVAKTTWIERHQSGNDKGYRWRRTIQERDPRTNEVSDTEKMLSVYVVYPDKM